MAFSKNIFWAVNCTLLFFQIYSVQMSPNFHEGECTIIPFTFFYLILFHFFSIFIPIPIYQKFCNQNFVLTQLLYHLKKLAEEPKAQFKTSLQTGISLSRFIISPLFYGNIKPFIFPDLPPTRLELVLEIDA